MANAVHTIMLKLDEVFAPADMKVAAETLEWAKGRKAALRAFQEETRQMQDYRQYRRTLQCYQTMWAICGGKTWYNVFDRSSDKDMELFVKKNCELTAKRRNASIAKRLEKAQVTEVVESVFTDTHDGFNGTFIVETNSGRKRVTVDTIYAGGYNIQCLHLRVLVKVK